MCHCCGANVPTKHVAFHQNIGALVVRFTRTIRGEMCKACIRKHYLKMTGITAAVGWVGVISIVVAPILILMNTVQFVSTLSLPSQHGVRAS